MNCSDDTTTIELSDREALLLDDVRGLPLRVTRGTLWLTQEGDTRDVVLGPGESWVVDRQGRTIIEAQGDVTLCTGARRVRRIWNGQRAAALVTFRILVRRWWRWLGEPQRRTLPYV